jgi:REP element-mobilizing transposase RayT
MPRRKIPLVAGEYYHVYNRGINRQPIFFERENYLFFLRRIREYLVGEHRLRSSCEQTRPKNSEVWVTVVAYCLMPNHFHFLLCPNDDQLSRCMQRLSISYTKAMNKRFGCTGSLFDGQFQAVRVDNDEYLLHLSRYIHLNPVMAGLGKRPEDWAYSSYGEYIGQRSGTLPTPDVVLAQFPKPGSYQAFVESYVPKDRETIAHLLFE